MISKKLVGMAISSVLKSFILLAVGLVMASFVGCGQNKALNQDPLVYRLHVVHRGTSVSDASVIGLFTDGTDTIMVCDANGSVNLETDKPLVAVGGVAKGLSGVKSVDCPGNWEVEVQSVLLAKTSAQGVTSAGAYVFGVYDTDGHGDVRFRYQFNFAYFYCSSGLPGWPYGDPNPNHWTSWNLTDFPYPWKGKKLLVPTRYQWWHQAVYGYSISRALFLVSTS